jgi:hypothetical protein
MISDIDQAFIEDIDRKLREGFTWQQIADNAGLPLGTVYTRVRTLGYRVTKRLEPINAPALGRGRGDQQVA